MIFNLIYKLPGLSVIQMAVILVLLHTEKKILTTLLNVECISFVDEFQVQSFLSLKTVNIVN